MRFSTVINCMDGRVQLPAIKYLKKRFDVEYVDSVTEAAPNLILAEADNMTAVRSILAKVAISIEKHNSAGIAIVGHYDCAGNSAPEKDQRIHIKKAVQFLSQQYENMEIIGLWIDENFDVHEVVDSKSGIDTF